MFQRPLLAFAAAFAACCLYFTLSLLLLSTVHPTGRSLSPAVLLVWFLAPAALCGLFHYSVTRDSDLSPVRRWVQIVTSAIGAPLLGLNVVTLAWILFAGNGF